MRHSRYLLIAVLFFSSTVFGQESFSIQVVEKGTETPLIGATVQILELNRGGAANEMGRAVFENIPKGNYTLRVSHIGYITVEHGLNIPLASGEKEWKILLEPSSEHIEAVVVSSTRSSRTIEDIPTRIEFIGGEELAEKGNMKPGDIRMLLNESTGIQTQQTSATSYNSSIRIQGLDGKYTQLLRDGMPLYSGFSGGLSLMQIAPLDLKQVEVIKGSSSTLYGGGAIAGLVNLISKTPEDEPELSVMVNGTSALGLDASGFFSGRNEKVGAILFTSYNKGTPYDPAEIGLTAIPKFDRISINPKVFIYPGKDSEISGGISWVKENRLGGNLDYVQGNPVNNPYFESNETDRISTQLRYLNKLKPNVQLEIKNSTNYYKRLIELRDYEFLSSEFSTFSEINLSRWTDNSEVIMGLNLWTADFDQLKGSGIQPLDFENYTLGAFIQNTIKFGKKWSLEAGLRADYQSDYELFFLPRFSLMYRPANNLTMRLGGGMGYKTPTLFTEETELIHFRNLLPIDVETTRAEESFGGNLDMNYRLTLGDELGLNINTLFFYTQINHPLHLSETPDYFFEERYEYLNTGGVELNLKWSYKDLKWFIGYTNSDVALHRNFGAIGAPLSPLHRLNNVFMYEKEGNFWLGLEAYYYSPQQLDNPMGVSESYWILGMMSEKKLGENLSVFINFENFLDTRQTKWDSIYTGTLENPAFLDIYAPVDGFVINGGIKWKMGGDHHD